MLILLIFLLCRRRRQVEGWLLKQGAKGLRKGFKKRWFSLQANRLHYFENKGDPQAKSLGFIDILAASAVVPAFPTPSSTNSSTKVRARAACAVCACAVCAVCGVFLTCVSCRAHTHRARATASFRW
jgi:hypothetical protein